jgi:hypothetical protein
MRRTLRRRSDHQRRNGQRDLVGPLHNKDMARETPYRSALGWSQLERDRERESQTDGTREVAVFLVRIFAHGGTTTPLLDSLPVKW